MQTTLRTALITGITGQDGSYLTELLLSKGYKVYGMIRRNSSPNLDRLKNVEGNSNLYLEFGDLADSSSVDRIMDISQPDEVYNLGAQSHVGISFDIPEYTADITGVGTLRLLEAIRRSPKSIKFYQASSSELYGRVLETPQTESTPFNPRSPYAVAKLYSFYITKNYREAYNLFGCNGILFNHESERRGHGFVTRKITRAIANIKAGNQDCLLLGNLDSKRDWGHAKDYVRAMYLMMQELNPRDYVIATGETHSVREFCEIAFKRAGINIHWEGSGINEVGLDDHRNILIGVDPKYFRPSEVDLLLGDPSKAKSILGWEPEIDFEELVHRMVDYDLKALKF